MFTSTAGPCLNGVPFIVTTLSVGSWPYFQITDYPKNYDQSYDLTHKYLTSQKISILVAFLKIIINLVLL